MCEPDCADDCEEHCQTAKYMAESSDEERRRIDFYRNQLKWRVAECPVEYIIDFERSGLTFNLHNKDLPKIIINNMMMYNIDMISNSFKQIRRKWSKYRFFPKRKENLDPGTTTHNFDQ